MNAGTMPFTFSDSSKFEACLVGNPCGNVHGTGMEVISVYIHTLRPKFSGRLR